MVQTIDHAGKDTSVSAKSPVHEPSDNCCMTFSAASLTEGCSGPEIQPVSCPAKLSGRFASEASWLKSVSKHALKASCEPFILSRQTYIGAKSPVDGKHLYSAHFSHSSYRAGKVPS